MIKRELSCTVLSALSEAPAVCLVGPRQTGKTTLALEVAADIGGQYLDLESETDRAKLADPEAYLTRHLDKLVILDEVHRAPNLFAVLRGLIDRARREGRGTGRYLLLGSAALDLLRACSRRRTRRVSAGGAISSAPTSSATSRSSARASRPKRCDVSGSCSLTDRGRRSTWRSLRAI